MTKKKGQSETPQQFIDTPAGMFTTSGNWFHISSDGLKKYAPGLFEVKSVGEIIRDTEAWIRSSDSLAILLFFVLLLTTNLSTAGLVSLIFLPLWHLNKSALVSPAASTLIRVLDKEFVVVLVAVVALSLLGINEAYYELIVGFLFFFLFKFGWYRKGIDRVYPKFKSGGLTLNDRLLRMLVLKYALAEGANVKEVEKMEHDFLKLIREQQNKLKKK